METGPLTCNYTQMLLPPRVIFLTLSVVTAGFYLPCGRFQQGWAGVPSPKPHLSLPPQAWWGALRGQPSSFPPHPGLAMGQDPRWDRCGAGGVSSSVVEPRHPNRGEHPDRRASLCRPFPLVCWAGASLTEVPAVLGGLRQPCGAIRGQRFCPQLAQGQAEPAAEGQAPKQTSISLCPPGQVSQTGSVGTSQPHHPLGPIRVFCGWEERK